MIYNPIETYKENLRVNLLTARFYLDRARLFGKHSNRLDNIYYCTSQKCGSQWISALFSDKRVRQITGLAVYPQHHYDVNDFRMRFPVGAFVPGLYIDYNLYDLFIQKPNSYKTFYIYRNPMDIAVSFYWSAKETHTPNSGVNILRQRLNSLTQDEGLLYVINFLGPKFAAIRSWVELGRNDPNVMLIKFEDLVAQPEKSISSLFRFLGYEVKNSTIKDLVADYSKENLRIKDMKRRPDNTESHYRKHASSHMEMFNTAHYNSFAKITGDLIERLGYEAHVSKWST